MSDMKSALSVGIGLGMLFGTILGMIIAAALQPATPDDVCKADCEERGFHQGQFVTEPEHCTCWNRDFEKQEEQTP